jgi:hypothetical protein
MGKERRNHQKTHAVKKQLDNLADDEEISHQYNCPFDMAKHCNGRYANPPKEVRSFRTSGV